LAVVWVTVLVATLATVLLGSPAIVLVDVLAASVEGEYAEAGARALEQGRRVGEEKAVETAGVRAVETVAVTAVTRATKEVIEAATAVVTAVTKETEGVTEGVTAVLTAVAAARDRQPRGQTTAVRERSQQSIPEPSLLWSQRRQRCLVRQ